MTADAVRAPALAWPPPGLRLLLGAAWTLARRIGVASTLVVGPLLWLGTGGLGGVDRYVAHATNILLAATVLVGCARLLGAAVSAWSLANRATGVVHRGYTWRTVFEVLADDRGDTGRLIDGTGAYAALSPRARGLVRGARRARAAAAFAAALAPIPAFALLARMSSDGGFLYVAPAIVFGPSVALLALNAVASFMERRLLANTERDEASLLFQPGAPTRVVDPWYRAFDEARAGHGPDRGRHGGSLFGLAAGLVVALPLLAVVAVALPVVAVASTGNLILMSIETTTGSALSRVARAERMRGYAVPLDSSITADSAGRALHALAPITRPSQRGPAVRPPDRTFPAFPVPGDSVFAGMGRSHRLLRVRVLQRTAAGLPPAERRFLAQVAANPAWDAFSTVARAPAIDLASAVLELPLPPDLSPYDMVSLSSNPSEFAHASVSRAAWHLANGRRAEAEYVLREAVSFGLRVMDESYTENGRYTGATLVSFARDALLNFYAVTGDSANLRTLNEMPGFTPRRGERGPAIAERQLMIRELIGAETSRGARWTLVRYASVSTCGNVRELLFGPSPSLRTALERAEAILVRSPAEQALFDVYAHALDRSEPRYRRSTRFAFSRLPATILGKPRILRCAGMWY